MDNVAEEIDELEGGIGHQLKLKCLHKEDLLRLQGLNVAHVLLVDDSHKGMDAFNFLILKMYLLYFASQVEAREYHLVRVEFKHILVQIESPEVHQSGALYHDKCDLGLREFWERVSACLFHRSCTSALCKKREESAIDRSESPHIWALAPVEVSFLLV